MGMTLTEKILARAGNKKEVKPGDFIWAKVDILMTHDPCAPGVIGIFHKEMGKKAKVWDREKIVVTPDHFIYTTDLKANQNIDLIRKFCKEQKIKYFYNPGSENYKGVCHITLAQEGHIKPGKVIIGTDSHTVTAGAFGAFATGVGNTDAAFVMATGKILLKVPESILVKIDGKMPDYLTAKDIILKILSDIKFDGATYMAMEFEGKTIEEMDVEERMTICNMVVEAGAKNGIMKPNQKVIEYLKKIHPNEEFEIISPDKDAFYSKKLEYNVKEIEPMVAKPHTPDNGVLAKELKNQKITMGYVGSCTGGKLSDFIRVANILKGKKVKVNLFAVPATRKVIDGIIRTKIGTKSIYEILVDAGVKLSLEPTCGACCGGPKDTFGRTKDGDICISTTNRNFKGRMGSKNALIFLASPQTVAASCLTGKITDPREILGFNHSSF